MPKPQTQSQSQSQSQTIQAQQPDDTQSKRTRCEIWTRVMGYHRPVSHFNIGKKSEHYSRKHFQACVVANQIFIQQYQDR